MKTAILLVDPQYDFFPGGALAVAKGDEIVEPINALLARHPNAPVFASRDWHPPETRHFQAKGGIWPPHCVQDTRGAAFHDGLKMGHARIYEKGMNPEDDAGYSAFEATRIDGAKGRVPLLDDLKREGVDELIVAGLATDYCVKASVLDALKHGFQTKLFTPGVRAVDVKPGDGEQAIAEMKSAGAVLID